MRQLWLWGMWANYVTLIFLFLIGLMLQATGLFATYEELVEVAEPRHWFAFVGLPTNIYPLWYALVGLLFCATAGAALMRYRVNVKAIDHEWMLKQLEDTVTNALIALLGGVFRSKPRLERLEAVREWVGAEYPKLQRAFAHIAATIVVHAGEGLDDLSEQKLQVLERAMRTYEEDSESVRQLLMQAAETLDRLEREANRLRGVRDIQADQIETLRARLSSVGGIIGSLQHPTGPRMVAGE